MQKDIFRLEYNLNILPSNKSRDADFDEILYNLNRLSDKISVDDGSRREVRAARDKDGVYSVERFAEENPVEKGSNIDAEAMLKRARRPKISPEEADEWVKKQGRRAGKRRYLTGAEPRRK